MQQLTEIYRRTPVTMGSQNANTERKIVPNRRYSRPLSFHYFVYNLVRPRMQITLVECQQQSTLNLSLLDNVSVGLVALRIYTNIPRCIEVVASSERANLTKRRLLLRENVLRR